MLTPPAVGERRLVDPDEQASTKGTRRLLRAVGRQVEEESSERYHREQDEQGQPEPPAPEMRRLLRAGVRLAAPVSGGGVGLVPALGSDRLHGLLEILDLTFRLLEVVMELLLQLLTLGAALEPVSVSAFPTTLPRNDS